MPLFWKDCPAVRYLLKVTISRGYGASLTKEFPFWVRNYEAAPESVTPPQQPIKVSSALASFVGRGARFISPFQCNKEL